MSIFKFNQFRTILLVFVASLFLFACGGGSGGNVQTGKYPTINKKTLPTPANLRAIPSDKQISLSWETVRHPDKYTTISYVIYQDDKEIATTKTKVIGKVLTHVVKNLTNGRTYAYKIRATATPTANVTHSSFTKSVKATPTKSKPADISGLKVIVSNQKATLSWQASTGATKYVIYQNSVQIATVTASTQYTVRNLINGTSYNFQIKAINSAGQASKFSKLKRVTPMHSPVLNLILGDRQVTLRWQKVVGATSYKVSQNDTTKSTTASTEHIFTNLTNGIYYYFELTAVSSDGKSTSKSEPKHGRPMPPIRGLKAAVDNRKISLSWQKVLGATRYRIDQSTGTVAQQYYTVNKQYTADNLTYGENYTFQVRAINVTGESSYSASVQATPRMKMAARHKSQRAVGNPTLQLVLNWQAVPGADSYTIHQAVKTFSNIALENYGTLTSDKNYKYKTYNVNKTSSTLASFSKNTRYYFVITAQKASKIIGYSNEISWKSNIFKGYYLENVDRCGATRGTYHSQDIFSVAFSPDSNYLATGGAFKLVLWNAITGCLIDEKVLSRDGFGLEVVSLAFSPDGKYLVTGDKWPDKHAKTNVRLWTFSDSGLKPQLIFGEKNITHKHLHKVGSVAFTPDSKHVVSGSWDNTISSWDVNTGNLVRKINEYANDPKTKAPKSFENLTIKACRNGVCCESPVTQKITQFFTPVLSVAMHPDGKTILNGNGDDSIRTWDFASGAPKVISKIPGWQTAVSYTPDGKRIVGTIYDYSMACQGIGVWDAKTWKRIHHLRPEKCQEATDVESLAVSPDGKYIAAAVEPKPGLSSAIYTGGIYLWNALTGKAVATFQLPKNQTPYAVAFSADSKIMVGAGKHYPMVWEIPTSP